MGRARLYPSVGVHGQVTHEIGRTIVSCGFAEGAFLPREAEFAERFGASRQAVREALKVLAAKGLVASRRRSGTRVLPRANWNLLDPDVVAWYSAGDVPGAFLRDLFELRTAIEPEAAVLAARRATPEQIGAIGAALKAMMSADKPSDAFFTADSAFHDAIMVASGNPLFEGLTEVIGPLMRRSYELHFEGVTSALADRHAIQAAVDHSLEQHAAVFRAIRDRDPRRAREASDTLLDRISTEIDYAVRNGLPRARMAG